MRTAILHRRSKKSINFAIQEALRSHVTTLLLIILLAIIAIVFILASAQENLGNFTISLDRRDMAKYGLFLSPSLESQEGGSKLMARPLENATNISGDSIPQEVSAFDGSNNGINYLAYSFYINNNGKEELDYRWSIKTDAVSRNVDRAIRVAVYYNGMSKTVYAKPASSGQPEPGTIPFVSNALVQVSDVKGMRVGSVDRYTVVIWLEGDDPDCVDELLGGSIKLDMHFEAVPKPAQVGNF